MRQCFLFYPCTSCCLPKRIQSREKICLLVFGEVQDTFNNWFMLNHSWSFIIPSISMKRPPHPAALFVNVTTVATDVLFSSTIWSASWFICFHFHFPVIDLLMLSYLPVVLLWGGLPLVWSQDRCCAPSPTSPPSPDASNTQPLPPVFFTTTPEIRDFNHLVTEITSMACRVYGQFVFSAQSSTAFPC